MEPIDILISDGIIITMDNNRAVFRGSVAVRGNKIVEVGKTGLLKSKYRAEREIDAKGKAVIPGFIDLHDHLRNFTPGLPIYHGLKIDESLKIDWRMAEFFDEHDYFSAAQLRCLDSVKSGTTCVVDHCYPFHRPGMDEQSLKAFGKVGIRGILARGIMTGPYKPISETKEVAFRNCRKLIEKNINERWKIMIAPVSFRQATPDVFAEARELADEYKVRLYTHVSETPQEVKKIKREHGKTPIAFLHQLGFSGPDVVLVHVVYPTEREIRLIHRTKTNVVDCPSNHMSYAKGVTPTPKLLNSGVTVAMGTDMVADMFTEMRSEILHQNLNSLEPAMQPIQALEMATINGAIALGLQNHLGSIEEGRWADINIVDLSKPHLTPLVNLFHSLVYSARASDVSTVLVDGKIVVEAGKVKTLDEDHVIEMARKDSFSYIKRSKRLDQVEKYLLPHQA